MSETLRKRVAGGVLWLDHRDRVLLVKPVYKPGREIPGGIAEPGESPRSAAVRECREELGIGVVIGRLLVCDWVVGPDRSDDGLMFVFDADPIDEQRIVLAADELSESRWCAEDEMSRLLPEFMVWRIVAARDAKRNRGFVELEEGRRVSGRI